MNLKSFPGPEPYIRVGGVEMVGETRDGGVGGGIGGDGGLQPDFWGPPTCQCWGGPLPPRFPSLVLLQEQWGQGAPAAC